MKLLTSIKSWLLKKLRGSWLAKKLEEHQTKKLYEALGRLTEVMDFLYDYEINEVSRSNVYLKEE